MTTPLLAIRGVKAFYGRVMALKGVDLEVKEGEIVTLIGANGAGKSTLMMTVCGNPRAREGTINFAGHVPARGRSPAANPASKAGCRARFFRPSARPTEITRAPAASIDRTAQAKARRHGRQIQPPWLCGFLVPSA